MDLSTLNDDPLFMTKSDPVDEIIKDSPLPVFRGDIR